MCATDKTGTLSACEQRVESLQGKKFSPHTARSTWQLSCSNKLYGNCNILTLFRLLTLQRLLYSQVVL
jgi:hypothetical protein